MKLADEILAANPGGGGKVAEHWYNAKRGAYYQVLADVKAGGGRKEVSRGAPVTVRSIELRQLFEAAGEVVHEAVLNALCSADAMDGRDGNRVQAFPHELLEHAVGVRRLTG